MLKGFNKGFTLIELVIVIVILGILAAIVVPKYEDLAGEAENASVKATTNAIRSGYAIAVAKHKGAPTYSQIKDQLSGSGIADATSGFQVIINTNTYLIPTYTSSDCSGTPTSAGTILCIGDAQS